MLRMLVLLGAVVLTAPAHAMFDTRQYDDPCGPGQAQVWESAHDQGAVLFDGNDALWKRKGAGEFVRYETGGNGIGIPQRVALLDGGREALTYVFATISGEIEETVLLWNDYVFYPECREAAPLPRARPVSVKPMTREKGPRVCTVTPGLDPELPPCAGARP